MVSIDEPRLKALLGESGTCFSVWLDESSGCLAVTGELEAETAPVFAGVIAGQIAHDRVDLRVDLSGLTFFDLRGFDALCAAQRDLESRGGALQVVRAGHLLRRVCELLGHEALLAPPSVPETGWSPEATGSRSS